jgi:4-hydroxy-tetrahydrodipicolinate synthase
MTTPRRFRGVWIPIITPFRQGTVDTASLASMVARMEHEGVSGFVACATTGEGQLLTDSERATVLKTLVANTSLPVVAGATGYTAKEVLLHAKLSAEFGPTAILVASPPYLKPSQASLRAFFNEIADTAGLPLILYDIPARTGVRLELDTILALAGHGNIVAIKDCGGRVDQTENLVLDGRLDVLSGNDGDWYATRCLGGAGAIAASAHIRTNLFVQFDQLLETGERMKAMALWQLLKPLTQRLFSEPSPAPLKALLAAMGECTNEIRAPFLGVSDGLLRSLRDLVSRLP